MVLKKPYARKRTVYRKKSSYRRNYRSNYRYKPKYRSNMSTVSRAILYPKGASDGLPATMSTKLAYEQTFSLNAASLADITYGFRLNSLYDPDYSGTGVQPAGLDQWANFYARYSVTSAKITVTFMNYDTQPKNCSVCCTMDPTTANLTYLKMKTTVPSKTTLIGPVSGGHDMKILSIYASYKGMTGQDPNSDENTQTFGTNPSRPVYFFLAVSSVDGTTAPYCYVKVHVDYYVTFSYKKILGDS